MIYNYQQKPFERENARKKAFRIAAYILIFISGVAVTRYFYDSLVMHSRELQPQPDERISGNYANYLKPNQSSASANIVAIASNGESGYIGQVTVEITGGVGYVLINTNPFIEPDTQESANIAADAAKKIANADLSDKNIIFDIAFPEKFEPGVVGGPSAGVSMAVAALAALEGKDVNSTIVATGTIMPDGSIGEVGGILEKAKTVGSSKKKMLLIPEGNRYISYYDEISEREISGGTTIIRTQYIPKTIDINEFAMSNWGLEVREISTLEQAAKAMIIEKEIPFN